MARQYQDMLKLKQSISVIDSMVKENLISEVELLYCEGKPDFSNAGCLRRFGLTETWGGYDVDAWFRVDFTVPPEMAGKDIWLEVCTGHEGRWNAVNPQVLVIVNGIETQGLDTNHTNVIIAKDAVPGEELCVDFDAWSGAIPDIQHLRSEGEINTLSSFDVIIYTVNDKLLKLYFDLKVPYEAAELLNGNEDSLLIRNSLRAAVDLLDLRVLGSDAFYQSVNDSLDYLENEFYGKICNKDAAVKAWCVGHTHIDIAWLWQYRHTKRKAERSFATALSLMQRYPEYIFMSSQPQLYQFIKDKRPALYERIGGMVEAGCWDPEGGMWVEADCNLSSGEALIRQFVHGKRFFKDEYGVDSKILWLPDVFGYSASLPQICKKCGIDFFMTTKINWNELNKLPADTFIWKGIDGTGILTHFIPVRDYIGGNHIVNPNYPDWYTTYNSMLTPGQVMGGWERYQQKDISRDFMVAYGYGDGGGGTTWEMLENLRRMEKGIPGCPVTVPTRTLDFFRHLEESVANNPRLPEWSGELYLEFHRGTYTSVARNKRNNRKAEQALQSLEALSVIAAQICKGYDYPATELNEHWKVLLLNQFHDVLPGSSIKEVYEDTDMMYANLFDDVFERSDHCKSLIANAAKRSGDSLVVFNTLGFTRTAYCMTALPPCYKDGMSLYNLSGQEIPIQKTYDGKIVFRAPEVFGMGWCTLAFGEARSSENTLAVSDDHIENNLIRVTLDDKGRICSLYDKTVDREVLKPGELMNVLETYEDRLAKHDAWDIPPYYCEKRYIVDELTERKIVEHGPVRVVIAQTYRYLDSEIRQNIIIYNNSKRIDFDTEVDWQNEHIMLKAAFPADILSDKATYEIQYGALERPTHFNTSWEHAKFETCAQKWADLSEDGYGVSVLNDCKYGYAIHGNTIRLTLLRSPMSPCVDADKGYHKFTYSIYPHAEGWRVAGTVREAYDLNVPLRAMFVQGKNSDGCSSLSLANSDSEHVNIEVLKAADNGSGFIVRLYEAHGRRGPVRVKTEMPVKTAFECDLLENDISEACLSNGVLSFDIRPYEIKTFRLH